jgi:nitroimidazol reductase NimA-like FMN-containing flavoprotein (pyridoxamine 5'-phosphate oxidase superfamily)
MGSTEQLEQTDRTRLRRLKERGSFDRALAHSILDEALVAHVGTTTGRGPIVLPMAHARVDDRVYVHGAPGNAILRAIAAGAEACITVTLLDGLVLARSAFHHSMNYRCVVLIGPMEKVTDRGEKAAASVALVDHLAPGRSAEARMPTGAELDATLFLRMEIREGSVKVRTGGPNDDEADLSWPVWAGHVPTTTVFGEPVRQAVGVEAPVPPHVTALLEG